jgi:Holliday junction resolvase RusA-like endonuclease
MTKVHFKRNPDIDELFLLPIIQIPTKQEKYKRLFKRLYWLKNVDANKQFETFLREKLKEERSEEWPLTGNLEIYVAVSAKAKRIRQIDIDNILKSVFDCLNGIVYKDDSQIMQVLGRKYPGDDIPLHNSLIIAIRKINTLKDSKFGNFHIGDLITIED